MLKNNTKLPLIGGIVSAIGASLCCTGPFILLSTGITGAWISNLSTLESYRPFFILMTTILFSFAGWQLFKTPRPPNISSCEPGTQCAAPDARKRRLTLFFITFFIALCFITSPYWLPLFV